MNYLPPGVWDNIKCYQIEYRKHWNIKMKESFNEIENIYELYSSAIHHRKKMRVSYYLNKRTNNINKKLRVHSFTS
tara:strand:- start:827 stop:1054 length:228 start_codon:yes stop_codon:yes gene_type:complete